MMKCPNCNGEAKVYTTPRSDDPEVVYRIRECTKCKARFRTEEHIIQRAEATQQGKLRFILSVECPEEFKNICAEESDADGEVIDASELLEKALTRCVLQPRYRRETKEILAGVEWRKDMNKQALDAFRHSVKNIRQYYELYLFLTADGHSNA